MGCSVSALHVPLGYVMRADLCSVAVSSLDLAGDCISDGEADCCCLGVCRGLVYQCVKCCITSLNTLCLCGGMVGCGEAGGLLQ